MIDPFFFSLNFFQDLFGQRDGGSAGGILFFCMVYLRYAGVVLGVGGHQGGEPAVYLEKDIDPHAEIAGIQKSAVLLPAVSTYLLQMSQPAGRPGNNGYAGIQTTDDIVPRTFGSSEFNGHIRSADLWNSIVFQVIYGYSEHDGMAAGNGDLFDGLTHFSVSDQRNFHGANV